LLDLLNKPQTLNLENHNNNLINLHKLLHKKLFLENIQSCQTKEQLEFYVKPKDKNEALHDNFIRYGTKHATSFLIIDIDNIHTPINQYKQEVQSKLGLTPNWITRTSKGYHIGFILEDTVYLSDTIDQEKLVITKKTITNILNGDIAGSHRLIGYWRNPLTHTSIINTDKLYTIDELYKVIYNKQLNTAAISNKQTSDIKTTKNQIGKINLEKINKDGFIQGNRNNYLYITTIGMLYNGKIENNQVEDTLINLNNKELPLEEIKKISKSIQKYNIKENTTKNEPYIKGEYYQDLWDNKIHNYKTKDIIEFSRQKIGQKISTAKILEKTIGKLIEGYKVTYRNNELFTNKNIIKNSEVSRSTIKRYRNVKKIEQEIKIIAFNQYMKELVKKKGVKADEPPIRELLNLALSELSFEYEKTGKVFAFMFNENDRLIFYEVP